MLMLNDAVGEARHLRAYWAAAILEPGEAESIENFAQARNLNAAPFEDALVEVQTSMGWRTYPGPHVAQLMGELQRAAPARAQTIEQRRVAQGTWSPWSSCLALIFRNALLLLLLLLILLLLFLLLLLF